MVIISTMYRWLITNLTKISRPPLSTKRRAYELPIIGEEDLGHRRFDGKRAFEPYVKLTHESFHKKFA
jgi:hypothetical protein